MILNEGEYLMGGDVRDFPRLECDVTINEDGRLVLHGVIPGKSRHRSLMGKASMHRDDGSPHYAVLENGQLVVYRGTPDHTEATVFATPSVSGSGPYQLGITTSKQLVVFRGVEGKARKIVWQSHP